VCHSENPEEWARAIAALLRDPSLAQVRAAARQYALTRTWARALEPLFRAYRDVLEGVAPATAVQPAVQGV
jgi:hypothetical protein